jgi:hypothetical protein
MQPHSLHIECSVGGEGQGALQLSTAARQPGAGGACYCLFKGLGHPSLDWIVGRSQAFSSKRRHHGHPGCRRNPRARLLCLGSSC